MTCIAWDGKTLAGDKRATNSGISRTVRKIERHGDVLLGMTGTFDVAAELREWFKQGCDPEKFPSKARDDVATLIVIDADGVRTYCAGPFPMHYEESQLAWGSGRDFAHAAMHLGCTASAAVDVACRFQTDCGNGIDTLELA